MFLSIMSNVPGRVDDNLLSIYNQPGFPSFLILDAEGKKVADVEGRDVVAFEAAFTKGAETVAVYKKAAAGDVAAVAQVKRWEALAGLEKMFGEVNQANYKEKGKVLLEKWKEGLRLEGASANFNYYFVLL